MTTNELVEILKDYPDREVFCRDEDHVKFLLTHVLDTDDGVAIYFDSDDPVFTPVEVTNPTQC
jgi:hypothetical protein